MIKTEKQKIQVLTGMHLLSKSLMRIRALKTYLILE